MNFIKKQTVSSWITLAALVFAIASIAMVFTSFKDIAATSLFNTSITGALKAELVFELIFLVAIIALSEFRLGGLLGDIIEWVVWALKIIVCILPILALIAFLGMRVQGLANLYFSDENIKVTMQATPGYMEAASYAIKTAVIVGVTAVLAIVAAFFRPYKKVKKAAAAEQAA
ncbi:MAG: hypothetical protein LUD50_01650 [Clostridia bacterium]|nr:hypothetical protein [Clostridia bacterium]